MKICFLAAADSIHSYRWIRFFAERGHEVHWLSLTPADRDVPTGVRFYQIGGSAPGRLGLLSAALRIRHVVRGIDPELLHAHYVGSYGLLGLLAGVRPFVVTAWGSDVLFAGRAPIRGPIVRRVLMRADLITCDAYHMVEAMRRLGTDTSKVRVLPFGLETDRFCPGPADSGYLARWAAQGRPVVISLRNLESVYDIGTLIDAVPIVAASYPEVRVVVAGSGSNASLLRERAAALRLEKNVTFIGRYENADLPRMLRTAQVYVSTSLSDAGLAASTAEAMSCGLAVVTTDIGENREWVRDGETGFLIQPGDSRALAARIVRLLGDPSLREAMGGEARQMIVTRDDYVSQMEKIDRYYADLIAGGSGHAPA